jgi:voltage-gated potassium channel
VDAGTIFLPRAQASAFRSAVRRLLVALAVLVTIATIVYADRDGYTDVDGVITWFDGLYYATVTASTTGYGDITPETQQARLVNVLAITPLRILFVVALIGSAFEVVTTTARHLYRQRAFTRRMRGQTVVIGYGTRGRAAVRALVGKGTPSTSIVVIDRDEDAVAEAVAGGLAAVHGDATRDSVQEVALIERAAQVLVAVSHDATSVLATLTSRRLAPGARITSSVRELVNAPLLHDSGADSVVVSAETAGRLLGMSVSHPPAARVLTDLLQPDESLLLHERPVEDDEVGRSLRDLDDLVLAVVRDGRRMVCFDKGIGPLQQGDALVAVQARTP